MLSCRGHEVITACNGQLGLAWIGEERPRLTILDLKLPDLGRLDVLRAVRSFDCKATVIILTGAGTDQIEATAEQFGAADLLHTGFTLQVLGEGSNKVLKE